MLTPLNVIVTEPSVAATAWAFAQQVATFVVALGTIWLSIVRPWMTKAEKKRRAEADARDAARQQEIAAQVEQVVKPIREQVAQIHRTTHINGGQNNPPTLRDEVNNVGKQVDTAIRAVGAVAVNQAILSERFDHHERDGEKFLRATREVLADHGIELPEIASSLPPEIDHDH